MINKIKEKYKNPVVKLSSGAIIGGILGFFYYTYFGCTNGTCAITSSPINTIFYFAFFGLVISYTNSRDSKKKEPDAKK